MQPHSTTLSPIGGYNLMPALGVVAVFAQLLQTEIGSAIVLARLWGLS